MAGGVARGRDSNGDCTDEKRLEREPVSHTDLNRLTYSRTAVLSRTNAGLLREWLYVVLLKTLHTNCCTTVLNQPPSPRISVSHERIFVSHARISVSHARISVSDERIFVSDERISFSHARISVSLEYCCCPNFVSEQVYCRTTSDWLAFRIQTRHWRRQLFCSLLFVCTEDKIGTRAILFHIARTLFRHPCSSHWRAVSSQVHGGFGLGCGRFATVAQPLECEVLDRMATP